MSDLSSTSVSLADRVAIEALLVEGVWRVDNGRASTSWELNTPDVVVCGLTPGDDVVGRDAVRAWGEQRDLAPRVTRHVVTNIRVFRDTGVIRATSILTMYRHEGEGIGSPLPFMVADFHDAYEQSSEGSWLLAERRITPIFIAGSH